MSMTKDEAAAARKAAGQGDATLGLNLVGKAIKGSLDYYGTEGEFKLVTDASPAEVLRPGFLDPCVAENRAYRGALIHVLAKSDSADPLDWSVGVVMIVAVRGMRVVDTKGEPVLTDQGRPTFHDRTLVGLVASFKKPTLVDDRTHAVPASNGQADDGRSRRRLAK